MIESFWKKYWFDMLVGLICFAVSIAMMFVPDAEIAVITYCIAGLVWVAGARIGYNRDRINALAKRVADLEAELYKE
jgi:uncharacterized membrane protein HdeD (DUF308 family)